MNKFFLLILFLTSLARAELSINYASDIQSVTGGIKEGVAVQGNIFLIYNRKRQNHMWRASVLGTHGNSPSELVGDLQTTSNLDIGGINTVKVFELFYEFNFNKLQVLGGMFDLASEFNVTEPASLFIHSSPGTSAGLASAGKFGTAFNPSSALSIRVNYNLSNNTYLKTATTDATPFNPDNPFGTQFSIDQDEGYFFIHEFGFFSENKYKLALGFWHFSKNQEKGYYLNLDYKVSSNFHPFMRYGKVDKDAQTFESNSVVGFTCLNWGVMYSSVDLSPQVNSSKAEEALEVSFLYERDNFSFTPHLQYIQNPALSDEDAMVIGLRISSNFSL